MRKDLSLRPDAIHIDFKQSMINVIESVFPETRIKCCRFHLGQAWWRNIQKLGLSGEYKDKGGVIGKWLIIFFGFPFLPPEEVSDCFVDDVMQDIPNDGRCIAFADYTIDNYVSERSQIPSCNVGYCAVRQQQKNEAFHSHFKQQYHTAHPSVFVFINVLLKLQTITYIKIKRIDAPATIRRTEG